MAALKFPGKTIDTLAKAGLRESDIYDVFSNGSEISGKNGMIRKYNGYEIGFFYVKDPNTGEYIITYAWKKGKKIV